MKPAVLKISVILGAAFLAVTTAGAGQLSDAPFTATLSNTTPLVFGMTPEAATVALGAPLHYVSGRPGQEILAASRPGGSGYFTRNDQLFLQFRNGRLTGWKGDWGSNWMWK